MAKSISFKNASQQLRAFFFYRNNLSPVTETGPLALPLEGRGPQLRIAQAAGLFTSTNATRPRTCGCALNSNYAWAPCFLVLAVSRAAGPPS